MTEQIGKAIVVQAEVVELLLKALFSRRQCLRVGVPGLARTLLVSPLSQLLHRSFKRIQLRPEKLGESAAGVKGWGRVS
jgi:MoxR-like ATPase